MGGEGRATAVERRRGRRPATVAVALSLATFGFAAYASSAGSVDPVVQGDGGWRWERDPSPPPPRPRELEVEPRAEEAQEPQPTVAGDVVSGFGQFLLVAAIAALVALLIHRGYRYATQIRLAPRDDADDWQAVPADAREELDGAAASSLDAARAGGPVRDVVIACWLALEAAAERAGIERAPSETAAELTVRVLGGLAVPPEAVRRLLGLYRTARYSTHELGEAARADAVAALEEIRRRLAPVPAP